jgi:hypothetical protein
LIEAAPDALAPTLSRTQPYTDLPDWETGEKDSHKMSQNIRHYMSLE